MLLEAGKRNDLSGSMFLFKNWPGFVIECGYLGLDGVLKPSITYRRLFPIESSQERENYVQAH